MSNADNVYNYLDASTAHLTPAERESLAEHFTSVTPHDYGWWVWVAPADDEHLQAAAADHPNVYAVMQVARELGCRWINFDADGEELDDLPMFEDDPCGLDGCESYPHYGHALCPEHLPKE